MTEQAICPNCFEEKDDLPLCPACKYDESKRSGSIFLPYRTVLNEQYVLGRELGKPGGFGIVYLAKHTLLKNLVAIKEFIPNSIAGRDKDGTTVALHSEDYREKFTEGLDRFLEEGQRLEQLDHQNIVRVKTLFKANDTGYLVMNYHQGISLSEHVKSNGGKISESETIKLTLPLLDGLAEVHNKKFLHRDIKPQNIYITENGRPILLDFGAARAAMEEELSVILTPGFAPFEQYDKRGSQGPWTDIYACAATAYFMITGRRPPDAMERETKDDLVPPNVVIPELSAAFSNALMKGLEKLPANRPKTALEFKDMLVGKKQVAAPIGAAKGTASGTQTAGLSDSGESSSSTHSGPTLTVSKLGEADHGSISEAIKAAKPGTRIYVSPGFYSENIVIDKPVEIVGAGPVKEIVIEGLPCILMKTDYSKIRGVSLLGISGPQDNAYSAVEIPTGRLVLENCDIKSSSIGCIAVHGAKTTPVIKRCKIHDGKHVGIWVTDGGEATIEECDISHNALAGIAIKSGGNPTVRRCVLRNGKKGGFWIHDKGEGLIEDCDIHNNALAGIAITNGASPLFRNCRIRSGGRSGVFVYDKGKGRLEDCDIYGNSLEGVEIKSGGNPVLKRCKIRDGKKSGVTVYDKGAGTVKGCEIFGNIGPGIDIKEGGNPAIKSCKIHSGKQMGVWVHIAGRGTIERCDIYENGQPGVAITKGGKPFISKCKIRDGKQTGLIIWKGGGAVEDCDIYGNAKSNVEFTPGSSAVVKGCVIYGGKEAGVLFQENGEGTVENCNIHGNAENGVRVMGGANPLVSGCRIHDDESAGVLFEENAAGLVEKCKIYANGACGVEIKNDARPEIIKCAINQNRLAGIKVHKKGVGLVEGCDLTGNSKGAFDTGFFSKIVKNNNKEK